MEYLEDDHITPSGSDVVQRSTTRARCTEDNSNLLLAVYIFLLNLSVILIVIILLPYST